MGQKIVVTIDAGKRERMEGVAKMGGLSLTAWVRSQLILACEASSYYGTVDKVVKARELQRSIHGEQDAGSAVW